MVVVMVEVPTTDAETWNRKSVGKEVEIERWTGCGWGVVRERGLLVVVVGSR